MKNKRRLGITKVVREEKYMVMNRRSGVGGAKEILKMGNKRVTYIIAMQLVTIVIVDIIDAIPGIATFHGFMEERRIFVSFPKTKNLRFSLRNISSSRQASL